MGDSGRGMSGKRRKIISGILAIAIGLPVAFTAWFCLVDKTNGTMVSSGETRRYLVYVPKTYDRSKATPLVISMHGASLWPASQMEYSRWNDLADEHGFIVVYPAGMGFPKIWRMSPQGLQLEVTFISDLIDKLAAEYRIDPTRVYADGFSNGGGMSFAVACRLSDRIAAVGAVAAARALPRNWCSDSKPVPMMAFHGTNDPLVPYQGVRDWVASWARRNQCSGDPIDARIAASVHRLEYTNCAENADVILYTVDGGGHSFPGGKPLPEWIAGRTTHEIDATILLWKFFVQHQRRPQ